MVSNRGWEIHHHTLGEFLSETLNLGVFLVFAFVLFIIYAKIKIRNNKKNDSYSGKRDNIFNTYADDINQNQEKDLLEILRNQDNSSSHSKIDMIEYFSQNNKAYNNPIVDCDKKEPNESSDEPDWLSWSDEIDEPDRSDELKWIEEQDFIAEVEELLAELRDEKKEKTIDEINEMFLEATINETEDEPQDINIR